MPPRQPSRPHRAGSSAATARFVLLAVEAGFLVRFENGPGLITSATAVLTGQHALSGRVVRWAEIGAGPFTGPPRAPAASVTPEHGHDVTVTAGMPIVEYGLPAAAGPVTTCPTSNTYDEYPNDGYTVRRTSPISTRNTRRCASDDAARHSTEASRRSRPAPALDGAHRPHVRNAVVSALEEGEQVVVEILLETADQPVGCAGYDFQRRVFHQRC